ncbi:MAG: ATP-binding cassette domain-containing protein [Pseudomonadota bacterium]|jgi:ABC-2 type transport system ATP-binding protein|nr:MAG: daunorubicin/doxorubicin resistance ABC transporter ATP-binding protein DrrA [Pseudomonadota bacterium]
MTLAVETIGLRKQFGDTVAVGGIDLSIPRGMVYGLLGPNGAGKTTTIRMLTTLLRPDGGTARVLGHDLVAEADQVRSRVAMTGQFASVDEDLTGFENLVLFARLLGFSWRAARARSRELLEAFELSEAAGRQARTYSGGMRRRLDIAASLIVASELLFLDEPTTGLDPRSRSQVWDIVRAIAAEGTTVLLTTQYLDEADRLASRLAVIDHGRLIAEGTSRELKQSVGGRALHLKLADASQRTAAEAILREVFGEVHGGGEQNELAAKVTRDDLVPQALARLASGSIAVAEFALAQPSLDDVFMALTGKPADSGEAGAKEEKEAVA